MKTIWLVVVNHNEYRLGEYYATTYNGDAPNLGRIAEVAEQLLILRGGVIKQPGAVISIEVRRTQ